MEMGLRDKKISAIIIKDEEDSTFIIHMVGKEGPIVSASSIEEAKGKFEIALRLFSGVKNLNYFQEMIKSSFEEKEKSVKNFDPKGPSVEYVECT